MIPMALCAPALLTSNSKVGAIGGSLEILVWSLAWSILATRLALTIYDVKAALGGLPGRVWSWLVVAWLWPGWIALLWFTSASWAFWALIVSPPLAAGLIGFEAGRARLIASRMARE